MDDYDFDFGNLGFDDGIDFSGIDFGNLNLGDLNLGDLSNLDLSGTDLSDLDMSRLIEHANLDMSGMGDLQGGGRFNLDDFLGGGVSEESGGGGDMDFSGEGGGSADLFDILGQGPEGLPESMAQEPYINLDDISMRDFPKDEESLTRALLGGKEGRNPFEGLRISGRGQLSGLPSETGTGITGEGFSSITDLLRSGTPEEIARYTPGTADYALHSGLEGDPFSFHADATQGANLTSMGGGQGLTKYVPAMYTDNGDLMPGTGGTLTELGFIPDKGSRVAIGDPNSWINNPAKTGEKAIVSQDNVVRTTAPSGAASTTPNKPTVTTAAGQTPVTPGSNQSLIDQLKALIGAGSGSQTQQNDWMKYLMMLLALDAMRNKGDSNQAVIPRLSGERSQTPYAQIQQAAGYRPGQGGIQYFTSAVNKAAGGGIGSLAGIGSVDSAGGRLLRGPGDGVSDSINAQIGNNQPARLADGEYVLDARTVSEIGNGSTEAGAKKLAAMVARIQQSRRHAKRGKPSNADKHLLA
jgi:hypothetical protein